MDQAALVREQLDGGEKLIRRLLADGADLSGGLWAELDGDGQPYLYLVSPEVENRDPRLMYRKISAAQAALDSAGLHWLERVDRFGIKLIPPSHPLARGVLGQYRRHPGVTPTWHHGSVLGSVFVDGAYIYPARLFRPQPAPDPAAAAPPAGV